MSIIRAVLSITLALAVLWPVDALAQADPCESIVAITEAKQPLRSAIAKAACLEHANWNSPFIGLDGRAAWADGRLRMEAEGRGDELADGTYPWVQVASYWRGTVALQQMIDLRFEGASDCVSSDSLSSWSPQASCRTFIIANAWSAAFVSYVLGKAGLSDFPYSHKHISYIRDAYMANETKPYRLADVKSEKPAAGDLLCYSRAPGVSSYNDLLNHIQAGSDSLNTHCDIVVAASPRGDSKLYVVGGNVLQTVMMRKLNLNSSGYLSAPRRTDRRACRVNSAEGCSLNEKGWIALLKLQRD